MPTPNMAYLYMELALIVFGIGFGWELWNKGWIRSRSFIFLLMGISALWFIVDVIAIYAGLWSFPPGGTMPYRILNVPIEECILFVIHTMACYLFVQIYMEKYRE